MKKREFNKHFNSCCKTVKKVKTLDLEKLKALPDEVKKAMAAHIVGHRGPLLVELAGGLDRSWLACMGYMHRTTGGSGFTFIHTAEHRIR